MLISDDAQQYVKEGKWVYEQHPFWCTGYTYVRKVLFSLYLLAAYQNILPPNVGSGIFIQRHPTSSCTSRVRISSFSRVTSTIES